MGDPPEAERTLETCSLSEYSRFGFQETPAISGDAVLAENSKLTGFKLKKINASPGLSRSDVPYAAAANDVTRVSPG